jgi:anthranilate synthase component 2
MRLLMIDNYDSASPTTSCSISASWARTCEVFRNDEITVEEIAALKPDRLVVSPGPCSPAEAGISVAAIQAFAGKIPLLGVCLGHQSIGAAFGGKIVHAKQLMHGKTSPVHHAAAGVFRGLPNPFTATRYHSLAIERASLPGLPGSDRLDRRRRDHGRAPQPVTIFRAWYVKPKPADR